MEKNVIKLVEKFNNSQILKDYGDEIRTEINNELDELRKENDEFSRRLENEESRMWLNLIIEFKNNSEMSNLANLVSIYDCCSNLIKNVHFMEKDIERFKDLVNTE